MMNNYAKNAHKQISKAIDSVEMMQKHLDCLDSLNIDFKMSELKQNLLQVKEYIDNITDGDYMPGAGEKTFHISFLPGFEKNDR